MEKTGSCILEQKVVELVGGHIRFSGYQQYISGTTVKGQEMSQDTAGGCAV